MVAVAGAVSVITLAVAVFVGGGVDGSDEYGNGDDSGGGGGR